MRMVVVLPAPLGPMNPYTSPRSSLIVRRLRAYRSPYILVRSRVSIMSESVVRGRRRLLLTGRCRRRQRSFLDGDVNANVGFLAEEALERRALLARAWKAAEPQAGRRGAVLRHGFGRARRDRDARDQDHLVAVARAPHAFERGQRADPPALIEPAQPVVRVRDSLTRRKEDRLHQL